MFLVEYLPNMLIVYWMTTLIIVLGISVALLFKKRWILGLTVPIVIATVTYGIAPWQMTEQTAFDTLHEAVEYDGQFAISETRINEDLIVSTLQHEIRNVSTVEFHEDTNKILTGETVQFTLTTTDGTTRTVDMSFDTEELARKPFFLKLTNPVEYTSFHHLTHDTISE